MRLGHAAGSTAMTRSSLPSRRRLADERERQPGEVRPSAGAADHDVGVVVRELELGLGFLTDHGLVHQHVIQDGAQGVLRVLAWSGGLDRLGDGNAEASRRVGVLGEDRASGVRLLGGARDAAGAERLHEPAPVRLLLVRDPDHEDVDLEPEDPSRERERRPPLAGAGLGRQARHALLLVVVRLGDRGIRLVRAGRRDALVLVVDACRRLERPLEPSSTVEGGRPPLPVHVAHLVGNHDALLGGDLLEDDRHGEERREIVGADRLTRTRMEHGGRRLGEIGGDVVPGLRNVFLLEDVLHLVAHRSPLCALPAERTAVPQVSQPSSGEGKLRRGV